MTNPFRAVGPGRNSFLPEDYIASKAESRANILTLSLFAVVLGAVIGAFMVTRTAAVTLAERKTLVDEKVQAAGQKIEQIKALEAQQARMMEKAEITAALVEKVPRWSVLGEIALRMPRDMRLDTLSIKSTRAAPPPAPPPQAPTVRSLTGKISDKIKGETPKEPERPKPQAPRFTYTLLIEGAALANNDVADFLTSLKNSPVLKDVEMAFIKEIKENEVELRKFQITAELETELDTGYLAESLKRLVAERTATIAGHAPGEAPQAAPEPREPTAAVPEKE